MGGETVSMFEVVQAAWAFFMVCAPIGLASFVAWMVWRARGLPLPEGMAVLRSVLDVAKEHGARIESLDERQDEPDDHLRALGRDVSTVGRVVPLRKERK